MARISTRKLSELLRRVGISSRAGVDLRRTWQQEAQRGSPNHQHRLRIVCEEIDRGQSMSDALRAAEYFPPLTIQMVDVGERAGRLDEVLIQLADHYDHLLRLRRDFLAGIAWPSVQFTMAVLVIGLVIWITGFLLPEGTDLVGFGLRGTSGLIIYLFIVACLVSLLGTGVYGLLSGWFGPGPVLMAMRIPVLGKCLQLTALSRLTWSLSVALEAGMDAQPSMAMAVQATQNPYYTAQLATIDQVLARRGEFHESLRATAAFPRDFLDDLEASEIAGAQSEMLMRLSHRYEQEARHAASLLTQFATFGVWLLVAGIIIYFIFRFAMIYLNAINQFL